MGVRATVRIDALAHGGDGVGRLDDGRTVFVPLTAPGDLALIEVTEERDRFSRARMTDLAESSPDRTDAPCPYFGVCGGCQWQHVSVEAQLRAKRTTVVEALRRIGGIAEAASLVGEIVRSPVEYGYRNKIELQPTADTRLTLGYARPASHEIVGVDRCLLLPAQHETLPRSIQGALRYLDREGSLGVTRVGVRAARNTRDVEIAVWTAPGAFPRQMAAETLASATGASSIVRVIAKQKGDRQRTSVEVLGGKGFWRERMSGLEFLVSAPSFFQVNTAAAELLVRAAVEALAPSDADRVVDLYAGAGTFTLPLSEFGPILYAVEAEGSSVRDLRRNLEHAQLDAEVIGGDAGRELAELGGADLLLVDPPRAGVDPAMIETLAASGARRIAYVSCDPATLARDVARLTGAGYGLVEATPFDLFPQTYHVETLAVLDRG